MLNAKKSKLISVIYKDRWKEFHKYELEFDDGTIGTIYKKSENPGVEENTEYDYTINDKGTIKIIDPNKPQNYNTPSDNQSVQKYIVRQSSLKASVDFWKAKQAKGVECSEYEIISTAVIFEEYVLLNKKPISMPF